MACSNATIPWVVHICIGNEVVCESAGKGNGTVTNIVKTLVKVIFSWYAIGIGWGYKNGNCL